MPIIKQGSLTLNAGAKGDKGDDGVSGGTSPSIKVVTNQTELTEALGVGIKELSIQADFTLTSDVTIPDGAILSDGGGKITVSTFDITFVNNEFKSDYLRAFIDLGANGTINEASTFSQVDFDIIWFGVVFDYDHSTGVGTDNFNILRQVFAIPRINNGGTITAYKQGAFATSVVTNAAHTYDIPTGVYMSGDNVHFKMSPKTIYQVLGNDKDSTKGFTIFRTTNSSVSGGLFRGDGRYWHTRATPETNHGGSHGVVISGKNDYLKFSSPVSEWEGDCLNGNTDYRAVWSSSGINKSGNWNGVLTTWDIGKTNDVGHRLYFRPTMTLLTEGVDYTYTGTIITFTVAPISGDVHWFYDSLNDFNSVGIEYHAFQAEFGGSLDVLIDNDGNEGSDTGWDTTKLFNIDTSTLNEYGEMLIGGNYAFQGESGFTSNKAYISFYDAVGTFIERTNLVDIFQPIPLKATYKQCRISLPSPDFTALDGTIFAIRSSKGIEITSPYISYGYRQGMSNIQMYSTLSNVNFINNGRRDDGSTSSPSYGVDLEDGYQMLNNINFINCKFDRNALGSLILKGTKYVKFTDCSINYNTFGESANFTTPTRTAFSTGNGHYTNVSGSTFKDADVSSGRYDKYIGNQFWDCGFEVSFEGEQIENNTMYNGFFSPTKDGSLNDGFTYISNNTSHFSTPSGGSAFIFRESNMVIKNHVVDYNGQNLGAIALGTSTNSSVALGSIDGFYVTDLDATGFETACNNSVSAMDINDLQAPLQGLIVYNNLPRDFTISNSSCARYEDRNSQFPNTGIGTFTTESLINSKVITPSSGYISGGTYTLRLREYDYNFYAENTTISYEGGNNTEGNSLLLLNNQGTKIFNKCIIRTDRLATTIDLNTQATNGAVTFIDCAFENITITLRAGDKILYTQPNANLEEFADNATAIAGGIPIGYIYRITGTGEVRMVIA
jgi:hypothetical protein